MRIRDWSSDVCSSDLDRVTVFVSTHFMNEAERCDRISLMHAGRVLVSDSPEALIEKCRARTVEEAFIGYLEEAEKTTPLTPTSGRAAGTGPAGISAAGSDSRCGQRTSDPRRGGNREW